MADPAEAYPLQWPVGVPRSRGRMAAPFTQTVVSAQEGLLRELRLMGARNVVISSDVGPRKADGTFYARAKMHPDDPGIAGYFHRKGRRVCFACDKYAGTHNNLHAIALTLEAIRGIERWGTAEMADAAFTGFAALPAVAGEGLRWFEVLGVRSDATEQEVETAYRRLAKERHPDNGGSDAAMAAINVARDEWRASR